MTTTTARQSPRIEYQVPVRLAHIGEVPERDAMSARTINVSAGGMALGVPAPLAIGETVVCHLWVAGERASLTGEVTWSSPELEQRSSAEPRVPARLGVRFGRLGEHDSEVLDHLLASAVSPEGQSRPVSVRFEGMDRHVLARGSLRAEAVRLTAALPILASGTPVDLRLEDGGENLDGEVLDSRLVRIGRVPVLEVDIGVSEDGPRARRQTFYGRASKLDTLEQAVAHIGNPEAQTLRDGERDDTGPPTPVDATWHRARLHTRRMWQPTPNSERGSWGDGDDTARDLRVPPHADDAQQVDAAPGPRAPWWTPRELLARKPGWTTVLAAAIASALCTLWLIGGAHSAPAADASTPDERTAAALTATGMLASDPAIATSPPTAAVEIGGEAHATAPADNRDAPARAIMVTANRQQTRVRVPIAGRPGEITTHLWRKPVAVVAQLEGARVLAAAGSHRVRRHGVSHVSIASPGSHPQVRVITTRPVTNYSVTATARWLEIRITP